MKRLFMPVLLLAAGAGFVACHRAEPADAQATHIHKDVPPHGGTPIVLSDDYKLELVRDASAGTLSAYVLDDEMEQFIHSSTPAITIHAKVGSADQTLVLAAVANPATGETVGDTSQFEGGADWLKTAPEFDGVLESIDVRGNRFQGVKFNFPKGSGDE